jgi:hypothetical protein
MKTFGDDFLIGMYGRNVEDIAVRLVRAANRLDETACVEVNEIMLVARPGDSAATVAQAWRAESAAKTREWKRTRAYWLGELRDRQEAQLSRQQAKRHLISIASLDLDDVAQVVVWVTALLGTDVHYDELQRVGAVLEMNGYRDSVEDETENTGQWLIAQFLIAVKQPDTTHMNTFVMSFERLVREWQQDSLAST